MPSKPAHPGRSGSRGELALLAAIRTRASQMRAADLQLGIGDDCALVRLRPGEELAVTTDLSIAGRHFRLDWHPPESVGHRTVARGLSDLAAMGARPVAAFLSLGLPHSLTQKGKGHETGLGPKVPNMWPGPSGHKSWLDRFLDGFLHLAQAYATPLAGGDLAESPLPVADIVLTGAVPSGKALLRSGARPGDSLYVTGSLGGSASGLARIAQLSAALEQKGLPVRDKDRPLIPPRLRALLAPHLYPQPRIAQGLWLVRSSLATSAIDISDGLSRDLAHLCEESGVAAEIDAAALPLFRGATIEQALHGGEDYELLFTVPADARVPRSIESVPVTRIGRILRPQRGKPMIALITAQGAQPLAPQGWEHFS